MLKSQFDLHCGLIEDQLSQQGISAHRDLATVKSRYQERGMEFFTILLPRFGKDLEKSLESGSIASDSFSGFSRRGGRLHDRRPAFLGQLFDRIFDTDGTLLEQPDWKAIRAIRQISGFHGKLKELCSDTKILEAYQQYVQTDEQIPSAQATLRDFDQFRDVSHVIWGRVIGQISADVMTEIVPKHGPGAVADKLTSNGKYSDLSWTERLDRYFPIEDYVIPGFSFFELLNDYPLHSPASEPPSRVIAVPKTMEKPRLIAAEPSYLQKVQQGVLTIMTRHLGDHPVIGWLDQTRNRKLALRASKDRSLSTLDLSEASDRVSLRLVKDLLRFNEYFLGVTLAARSQAAELPTGERIYLRKFASMGSAMTFPIESMVFWTIVVMAVCRSRGEYLPTKQILKDLLGDASVYGDDIIVPVAYTQSVVELLELFGLKVNVSKSFTKSHFRESCGAEFFDGHDVTIVRARKGLPVNRQHVEELTSLVAMRNLYANAYGPTRFVQDLDSYIEGIIPFPVGTPYTPALVKCSNYDHLYDDQWLDDLTPSGEDDRDPQGQYKWQGSMQRLLVRATAPVYLKRDDALDDYGALLKALTTPFQEDKNHLKRAGRPVSATLKYGWFPVNGSTDPIDWELGYRVGSG
jgi:hypothetical protein